jgi:enoyl-CoA hydratase/carnithine racemase
MSKLQTEIRLDLRAYCRAIVIGSSSARAFCSGGDVKIIALQIKENDQQTLSAEVLGAEYNLVSMTLEEKKMKENERFCVSGVTKLKPHR